jgi:hypothetical protein
MKSISLILVLFSLVFPSQKAIEISPCDNVELQELRNIPISNLSMAQKEKLDSLNNQCEDFKSSHDPKKASRKIAIIGLVSIAMLAIFGIIALEATFNK